MVRKEPESFWRAWSCAEPAKATSSAQRCGAKSTKAGRTSNAGACLRRAFCCSISCQRLGGNTSGSGGGGGIAAGGFSGTAAGAGAAAAGGVPSAGGEAVLGAAVGDAAAAAGGSPVAGNAGPASGLAASFSAAVRTTPAENLVASKRKALLAG